MITIVAENANDAFERSYAELLSSGIDFNGTKALFNFCIEIINPGDNIITNEKRSWSLKYALREWNWYLSGDRSVKELKKHAPLWDKMHGGDDMVWSNYGYHWLQNNQLGNCIEELRSNPFSRRAVISIFDGKMREHYKFDTPCTLSIHFQIFNDSLNMSINMRSNDNWYGFCKK